MGEDACVNDRYIGECARNGKTLANHCHPDMERDGCRFYWTKEGVTPLEFQGFMQAVAVCRARQKAGLDLTRYELPYWAEKAYLIGTGVYTIAEAELNDDTENEGTDYEVKGSGDSGAFKLINQHMQELRLRRTVTTYGTKRDGSN
jgi:hypothetical protein